MPNVRWLLRLITLMHLWLFRATRGRVGGKIGAIRVLVLETVGRKSGRRRALPLLYVEDAGRFVVVGSNAGDDRDPAWWLNLRARPEALVQVGARRIPVKARQATREEAAELWPKLEASYPPYARYRTATSREIPVILLERDA